jgi:hypothetical protein
MLPKPSTLTLTGVIQQVTRAQQLPIKLPALGDISKAQMAASKANTMEFTSIKGKNTKYL